MNEKPELRGPFYIELTYEADDKTGSDPIQTAFIDELEDEASAWAACNALREREIIAVDSTGVSVTVKSERLLQMVIGACAMPNALAVAAE